MWRKIIIVLVFLIIAIGINAQEQDFEGLKPLYFGFDFTSLPTVNGFLGSLDFGLVFYRNEANNFNLRTSILLEGGYFKSDDVLTWMIPLSMNLIYEKFSLNQLFRYYVLLQSGIGVYANNDRKLFETPLTYNGGIGAGIDIFVEERTSIFFESRITFNLFDNEGYIIPKFKMGKRYYF